MFVTNWISTTKIQKISEITNFFRHYFLSRTEVMYTVSDEVMSRLGSRYIYFTTIFVLAGILRYMQLTIVDVKSGSPTKVLMKDKFVQLCIIGWILAFLILIYL